MIVRPRVIFIAALVFGLSAAAAHAQWTPPVGIPAPSFGVNEVAPQPPSPWTAATPGFYYVDATQLASTDTSNPYGTPAKPRRTIPTSLPGGAVVELHGTYDVSHSSPATIWANGTSTAPVFIRGASASTKPLIRNAWQVKGTYVILENLEFGPLSSSQTGSLVMLSPMNHAALRYSDLHGNLNDGGLGVLSWDGNANQNVVILGNRIHDNGDLAATFDQDVHGIGVNERVSNLWVVDNQLYRNSGDGIQINGGAVNQATTHHIYVGRNTAFGNKQTGFWVKEAVDVILSQNVCRSHRPSNSSNGQCMGYQYAPQWIWFLYNNISDSDYGIAAQSDHDLGFGTEAFFIGNVIYNIHPGNGIVDAGNSWASAAIMLAGGVNRRVLHNTIYDVNAGVNVPAVGGSLEIRDNIISTVVSGANHVFVEDSGLVLNTAFHHNLLYGDPRVRLGGSQQHLTTTQLSARQSFGTDPLFVNAAGRDFHLQSTSRAIDTGDMPSAYTTFQQRYGLSLLRDADGTVRPSGLAMDMGAYEKGGCAPSLAAAPTGLTAAVVGTTVTLRWTASSTTSCSPPTSYWLEAGSMPGLTNLGAGDTGSTATTLTFNNLPAGAFYVRVKAANAVGVSPASNEALVTVAAPLPPTNLVGSVSGTTLTMTWRAPTSGLAPTGYLIEVGTASGRVDASGSLGLITTLTAPGVAPGTYYIRVRATAGSAKGAPSNEIVLTVR